MTTVILIIAAVIIVIFAILAFMLNNSNKEKKDLKEKLTKAENGKTAAEEVIKNYSQGQKENEKLLQMASSANSSDSANAGIELLHNISTKGQARNNS